MIPGRGSYQGGALAGPAAQSLAISFIVAGEPVSKARPRVTRKGTYTPPKTLVAEEKIGWAFRAAARGHIVRSEDKFAVGAVFYCGTRYRRDIDNLIKTVLDGLNSVAWKDDHQVSEITARKIMVTPGEARTEITVAVVDWTPEVGDVHIRAPGGADRSPLARRGSRNAPQRLPGLQPGIPARLQNRRYAQPAPAARRTSTEDAEGTVARPAGPGTA